LATFTITTAQNISELTSKAGGDIFNVNGGVLTIDQDSRYGLNQTTSASLGTITISATLGGTVEVDARYVRLIPYDTGTGNVPACNTSITQGGASGLLLGVYSALNVAPTAVAAAMPVTGYIKIKQWNGVAFAAGALTGIGANATGTDVAGWIELVGDEASTVTANRLGLFRMRGEWYLLGQTSGSSATTYQIPSNGTLVYLPGVWVETGSGTGVYEFYPCAGTLTALLANVQTDAVRGKLCWIANTGLLRFQNDGTNSTGGYLPSAGCNIRIPNIFCANCTTAARTANVLPNATLATRYDFTTTGGGVINIDKVSMAWYPSFTQPYSVSITNTGICTQLLVAEMATPIAWSNVGVGQEAANAQFGLSMSLCFAGGTMDKCVWTSATLAASGRYVVTLTDISGFTITNEKAFSLVARGNATTGCYTMLRAANCTWTNTTIGVGRALMTTCTNCSFTNTTYYDHPATTTATANPMYIFDLASNCSGMVFDGVSWGGLVLCQPYSGILNLGVAGCYNTKLRNMGTYASPLDMGGTRVDGATWTRATTTATITSSNHGLKINDIIYVIISSDIAAITVATKTVASSTPPNTFTFTCLNAGAASGTINYYPTMSAYLFACVASAAANTLKVQRCYTPHTRTNLYTADNSSKYIYLDNVYGDFINAPVSPQLVGTHRGVGCTHAMTAQTSVYGTHWFDIYTLGVTSNIAAQSWSRATTTATITSNGHNLRTGMLINVTVTSDAAAIVLGQKTITATTANAFTFTCLNAGAASGTLTFAPLQNRIGLLMNEATSDTSTQYSIDSGTPGFTSAGGLYMPVIGQQVTFTTPDYIIGHTSFPIAEAVMAGGTIGNYDITYAIDKNDGGGYGAFHNLYYPRAGGSGSNGQPTFTVTSGTGVEIGDYVWGTNIGYNARVTNVNVNTITVDINNIGTVSGVIRFAHLPYEASINAQLGFKLKIRIYTSTTNATAITSLYFFTLSTEASRAYQYVLETVPLSVTVKDTLGTPLQNIRVAIYKDSDNSELMNKLTDVNGVASGTCSYVSAFDAYVRARKTSSGSTRYVNYESSQTVTSTGLTLTATLEQDTIALP
jgi:hypothetical protein